MKFWSAILVFITLLSCEKKDGFELTKDLIPYSFITFEDYNKQGVYLLDTRNFYKNILYFFSYQNNQWTPVTDASGLPFGSRYESMDFSAAFSISPDSILAVSSKGEVFIYKSTEHIWTIKNSDKVFDINEYSYSPSYNSCYFFNELTRQVYAYVRKEQYGAYELFYLEKDFHWQKADCKQDLTISHPFFYDKENIWFIKMHRPTYYFENNVLDKKVVGDSILEIYQLNISTREYNKIKEFKYSCNFKENDDLIENWSLNAFSIFFSHGSLYLYNYTYFPKDIAPDLYGFNPYKRSDNAPNTTYNYGIFEKIPLNGESPLKTDTLEYQDSKNLQNNIRWGEIEYFLTDTRASVYNSDNYLYFFINEFIYKYSIATNTWTAVAPLPFNELNKK